MKKLDVDRMGKKIKPSGLHIVTKEQVDWKITSINPGETLVLTSLSVDFPINASGGLGIDTVTVIIPNPVAPVAFPYTLTYTISVQNSSPPVDVTDSLVIDTIGPPTPPKCRPEDEDEPVEADYSYEEQH